METIRDGKGKGNLAGVDDDGFLQVRAINIPQAHFHAKYKANGFVTTFGHVTATAGVKEIIGIFTYTGVGAVALSKLGLNTNSAGRTSFYIYGGPEGIAGGVVKALTNTNTGSRYALNANLLHTDDGVTPITYTSLGQKLWEVYAGYHAVPYTNIDLDNAFIILPGTTFAIITKSETAGDKVGANIFLFEDNNE